MKGRIGTSTYMFSLFPKKFSKRSKSKTKIDRVLQQNTKHIQDLQILWNIQNNILQMV